MSCSSVIPINQLVMIPVQVKCISVNTLVSVTGITLVIDRLFVLNVSSIGAYLQSLSRSILYGN